jgi:ABC-type sugar transport system permease subunit
MPVFHYLKKEKTYLLFILPTLLFMSVFLIYPLAAGISVSLTNWDGFSMYRDFVGINNFKRLFADITLPRVLRNTFLFTILETIFCNILGLVMAVLLQRPSRLNTIIKTLMFMPFVISLVLSAYMVQNLMYEICELFGWISPLAIPNRMIPALSLIAIWRDSGYCMIIYIAALLGVDESMYEAARIEGADPIYTFFTITLPSIIPAFTANITLLLAWGLKLFEYSMVAVRADATESINVYVYKLIFPGYRAGYGQALALTWLVVIFIITNVVSRLLRRMEIEQ